MTCVTDWPRPRAPWWYSTEEASLRGDKVGRGFVNALCVIVGAGVLNDIADALEDVSA